MATRLREDFFLILHTLYNEGELAPLLQGYMRGIWKVLSTVFYLSNRFLKPIIFGIILKRYLSTFLRHKFHEDIIMQPRKMLL